MPTNVAPFEIVVGVGQAWIAPVGEAFPAIDATPAGNWLDLGSTDDDGVSVMQSRETEEQYKGNSPLLQKITLVSAKETIKFKLAQITVERYAKVLDDATVITTAAGAGTAGHKAFNLAPDLKQFALLIRGPSPVMGGYCQYEYARASPTGERELAFKKKGKTVVACTFEAFEDTNNAGRFGTYRAISAAAV